MGSDSMSFTQSKRAGGSETACLGSCWGEPAWMGGEQGMGGGRDVFTGEGSIIGDTGGVYHMGGSGTAHFLGVWGELGGGSTLRGCSARSSHVLHCSGAAVCGPE